MTETQRVQISESLPSLLARLWRFGLVLSGDPSTAEDLVQETCLSALENSHQLEPGARLDRWTFAILNSIWRNGLRARRIREEHGFVSPAAAPSNDNGGMDEMAAAQQALQEVQSLPEAQRAVILLVYVERLTYSEAAQVLGIALETVQSRLAAARATLGQLGEQGMDEAEAG